MDKGKKFSRIMTVFCLFSLGLLCGYLLCRATLTDKQTVIEANTESSIVSIQEESSEEVEAESESVDIIQFRIINGQLQACVKGVWMDGGSVAELAKEDPFVLSEEAREQLKNILFSNMEAAEELAAEESEEEPSVLEGYVMQEIDWTNYEQSSSGSTETGGNTQTPAQESTPAETPAEEVPADGEDMEWTDDYL